STEKIAQGNEVIFNFRTPFNGNLNDLINLNGTDLLLTVKSAGFTTQRYQSDPGNNEVYAQLSSYGGYIIPNNNLYNPVADNIEKNFGENTTQEEVFSKITIPDYPEDKQKPKFTI